ncbi:MAG: D-sedoheptulose 7-phosphate isomerase [Bacteroidota bacterium]
MQWTRFKEGIRDSIELKERLLADEALLRCVNQVAEECVKALRAGHKILWCGNGGSAADAQHLAGELSGRFYYDRPPLSSEALHGNGAYLTAVANDYGYDEVFARMVAAVGQADDVLIALTTSGNSPNILRALARADEMDLKTVCLTGSTGGKVAQQKCDYLLCVPSTDTPRIQECHMLLGHLLCEIIEAELFPKKV